MATAMNLQPSFDYAEGQRRKEEGMARAALNSHEWQEVALLAVERLARQYRTVTCDDLHVELELLAIPSPPPNAWGTPFKSAAHLGMIKRTPETQPSERADARGREIRVWKSLIHPER